MIKSNNNLGYVTNGVLQVEDFQNIIEYSSYMMPNNIVVASYYLDIYKDYRNYSGYSYEMYYLDDHSNVNQLTYNVLPGNGLVINDNGLISIEIDEHTLQKSENGLFVNTYNLNTAYSYFQKGLIVGDNKPYRNYFSDFTESGFIETRNGIVSLNHGFVHDLMDIKTMEKQIDIEINSINNLLLNMFNSRKYHIGDILYFDTNTKKLVDEENPNTIPYMICVISSDTTDDKLPRFIKIEEKNYYYPQSSFASDLESLNGINYYNFVPIFEVPWSKIKPNSNIIFATYGFIALDRYDWLENFQNPFNYEEHYYCNSNPIYTGWYLDASYVSYNNPNIENWTVGAGGFYTFNMTKEITKNVDEFIDLTDNICVIYNNIIKHYKVDFKYDKKNNRYVSVTDSKPYGGTGGIYVMSEKSIGLNITWSNILKNPYKKKEDENVYELVSAFIPYREVYDYQSDSLVKRYANTTILDPNLPNEDIENINNNPSKYDWEWKHEITYSSNDIGSTDSNIIRNYINSCCLSNAYINLDKLVEKTGIPNIGLKLEYSYIINPTTTPKKEYKLTYEYFIYKSKYYSYKFISKDQNYLKKNKSTQYYDFSESFTTRLYDATNNYINWQSSYNTTIWIPYCYNYQPNMEVNPPTVTIKAFNLNDLKLQPTILGTFALKAETGKNNYGKTIIGDFKADIGDIVLSALSQNHLLSNTINHELRDYRLATEGPVYFKPDVAYVTAQQTQNEYLLHCTYGNIINNILDYRSTFIDYYLYANKAVYSNYRGSCNILSPGCIWLYDPYRILYNYANQNVLISLNVYSANEEIYINKLFKFKIELQDDFTSYMIPDWYDINTMEYMLQCEQKDISKITFNHAIDFDSYDKHKKEVELDDVPLAPEGTIIYFPPEPTPEVPDDEGGGGGSVEPDECVTKIPDNAVEMWIVEDYVEIEKASNGNYYAFLHDMALGIKFKENDWGQAIDTNNLRQNLQLGDGGRMYVLYFEMHYPDSSPELSNNRYIAFTYRNYKDSKGYVLKLCAPETVAINTYDINGVLSADTNETIPKSRNGGADNDGLLKFNIGKTGGTKGIKDYFINSQFKFELIGVAIINTTTQKGRSIVPLDEEKTYSINTYYAIDKYPDKNGSISMTERVTVWTAFKYLRNTNTGFGVNPPHNYFGNWPKSIDANLNKIEETNEEINVSLSELYKTENNNKKIIYIGSKYNPGSDSTEGGGDDGSDDDNQGGNTGGDTNKTYEEQNLEIGKNTLQEIKNINTVLINGLWEIANVIKNKDYEIGEQPNIGGEDTPTTPTQTVNTGIFEAIGSGSNGLFIDITANESSPVPASIDTKTTAIANNNLCIKSINVNGLESSDTLTYPFTITLQTLDGNNIIDMTITERGNDIDQINISQDYCAAFTKIDIYNNSQYTIITTEGENKGKLNKPTPDTLGIIYNTENIKYEITTSGSINTYQLDTNTVTVKSSPSFKIGSITLPEGNTLLTNYDFTSGVFGKDGNDNILTFTFTKKSGEGGGGTTSQNETINFGLLQQEHSGNNDWENNPLKSNCNVIFSNGNASVCPIANENEKYDSNDPTKIYFGYKSNNKSLKGHGGLKIEYSDNTLPTLITFGLYKIDETSVNISNNNTIIDTDGLNIESPENTYISMGYIKIKCNNLIIQEDLNNHVYDKTITISVNDDEINKSFTIKLINPGA